MPLLRYIPPSVPCEASIMEDIEAGVDGAFEAMVTALTKPLTEEEKFPKPKEIEKPARIIFKGSLEEINRVFYQRGWTDGFPIIPPTEEAVADMLTGTDLPADHLLGKLESRLGKATIERIAINAVMAGALPTYMPVLIAGTKLLLESERGVMGNPMKYSMVIAENEEESPWEPLHVEYGYKKEESTMTLSFPQTYIQHWPYGSDAEGILREVVDHIIRRDHYTIMFTPPHAKNLAREGWTKEDIKGFISGYARIPGSHFNNIPIIGGGRPGLYKGKICARDTDTVALIRDPRFIRIIVAGGPGAFIAHTVGGGATPGMKQTQKIELTANWHKLAKKYKNIVPTYAKY